jgi:tripartite-type tricarboxylate transporter receptor subunit TctC
MAKAVTSADTRKEFDQQVAEVHLTSGEEFRAFVAREIKENAKLVEAAGLKPE